MSHALEYTFEVMQGYILTKYGSITTIQINKRKKGYANWGKLPQVQGISGCKDGLETVE